MLSKALNVISFYRHLANKFRTVLQLMRLRRTIPEQSKNARGTNIGEVLGLIRKSEYRSRCDVIPDVSCVKVSELVICYQTYMECTNTSYRCISLFYKCYITVGADSVEMRVY